MPVTQDIVSAYRRPRAIMRRLVDMGRREDRALILLLMGCIVAFIAQSPWQAREAFYDPSIPLEARLYWSALFWVFIMPLVFYALSFVSHLVIRAIGGQCTGYGARLALFWAFLASSPFMLLLGLVAGFIGSGPQGTLTALVWVAVFLWFWFSNLREVGWSA